MDKHRSFSHNEIEPQWSPRTIRLNDAAKELLQSDEGTFSMSHDLSSDMNLYLATATSRRCLIQLQLDYNPTLGHHVGIAVIPDNNLYHTIAAQPDFNPILDEYFKTILHQGTRYFAKWDATSNSHRIKSVELVVNGSSRRLEQVQQVRPGDCVLATFLNTCSLERGGQLPMSIDEARRFDLPRFSQPAITEDFNISANSFGVR